ncbi:MAG: DUF3105 domain-containing protein [Deltaproteobacteria bacterium]|nr:DUF3105 domain-containing protein [Deltaproteobacteria bacterium]
MTRMKPMLIACLFVWVACSDSEVDEGGQDAATPNASDAQSQEAASGDTTPDVIAAGACNARVMQHADQGGIHIAASSYDPAIYNSNPPSSGPHCGTWGAYTTFDAPALPRCNYIHNLEHGAVVLLHNCPSGCSDVKSAFASLVQGFKGERDCPNKRFIITPDAALATKVAAAAWGWTFTADCLDAEALKVLNKFVDDHYSQAPETVCGGGFSP